jgi:hypothetical protein
MARYSDLVNRHNLKGKPEEKHPQRPGIVCLGWRANRVTLLARCDAHSAASKQLYEVCDRLQRITDEDLGALGGTLHSDLFYNMATTICGDDELLLKSNCLASAQSFKDSTDHQRLRNRDLLQGLLTTLVYEVYTHGEVEFIQPLYREWFEQHMGVPRDKTRFVVAWVTVYVGGTERNHLRECATLLANHVAYQSN